VEIDLLDKKGYGHPDGNIKLGAGIVFSEAHQKAASVNRFIVSGWAITVGVIGWSIGGGHGPFAPGKGVGVDNILEATLVTADGEIVTVNSTSNSDLYWAIRGGGGSTWGLFTSITYRMHKIPEGGFTFATAAWQGNMCENGKDLISFVDSYKSWSLTLNSRIGGLTFFIPATSNAKD